MEHEGENDAEGKNETGKEGKWKCLLRETTVRLEGGLKGFKEGV